MPHSQKNIGGLKKIIKFEKLLTKLLCEQQK